MQANTTNPCSRGNRRFITLIMSAAMLVFPTLGKAQEAGTGNIQGTITDPAGAVIPNASITLTEAATQGQHTTVSDTSGVYVFSNMVPATYSLSVTAPGFEGYTSTGNVPRGRQQHRHQREDDGRRR